MEEYRFDMSSKEDCETLSALLKGVNISVYGSLYEDDIYIGVLEADKEANVFILCFAW